MQTTNISLSFHQLQSLLQTKKTADKQNHQKSFYTTSIYTHHLWELLKTSTVSHFHHRKPIAVGDSISPVIMTLQLLA